MIPPTEAELSIERIDPYLTPERQRLLRAQGFTISRWGGVSLDMSDPRNQAQEVAA